MMNCDFVVDTAIPNHPKIVKGEALNAGRYTTLSVGAILRTVPLGGQWMKKHFDLDKNEENFAWCFGLSRKRTAFY